MTPRKWGSLGGMSSKKRDRDTSQGPCGDPGRRRPTAQERGLGEEARPRGTWASGSSLQDWQGIV